MKRFYLPVYLPAIATLLLATPALAMKVTNLDNVTHRVLFEDGGKPEIRVIEPDATEYFTSEAQGRLSLLSAEDPKPSRGTLHADGALSGIIGAERTDQIPTDSDDNYAIWPGGKLGIQQHQWENRGTR